MGYKMIEIAMEQKSEMAEHAQMVLKHAGKLMQCIEDLCEDDDDQMGQRGGYMGSRMGRRGGGMGRRVYPSKGGYPTYEGYRGGEDWEY